MQKVQWSKLLLAGMLVVATIALVGCPGVVGSDTDSSDDIAGTGSLSVRVTDGDLSRSTIKPDITMEISEYAVSVSGPGETQSADISSSETTATFDELEPGDWTVTVNAKNAAGVIIARGTDTVTVVADDTVTADITVVPLSGEGTLDLEISWPEDLLAEPAITATLTPTGGSANSLSFTIDSDTASYSGSWDAGYYDLSIVLRDGDEVVWAGVFVVRIIEGEVSSGVFPLTEDDLSIEDSDDDPEPSGSILVNIGSELNNPYEITFTGLQAELSDDENMTVGLSLDLTTAPDSIRWYVNGELIAEETGDSLTIGPDGHEVGAGKYWLDVIVSLQSMSSSQGARFTVTGDDSAPSGEGYTSANIGTLVYVPAGSFQRDDDPENISVITQSFYMSEHQITQSQFEAIMEVNPSNFSTGDDAKDRPVDSVSWYDAIAFANKLSIEEGLTPVYSVSTVSDWAALTYEQIPTSINTDWNNATADWDADGYRLPTEMEWMWAAMGANQDAQPGAIQDGINRTGYSKPFAGHDGTNSIDDYAWYLDNIDTGNGRTTPPVGTKLPNELGL